MKMKTTYRTIAKPVMLMVLTMLLAASCHRKPLYLAGKGNVDLSVAVYDIRLELLWGVNWEAEWQYSWATTLYGDLGYTKPEYIRATFYNTDPIKNIRNNPQVRNFGANGGRVTLSPGAWYDMLFFNAGTEYVLFSQDAANSFYKASTRSKSAVSYTKNQVEGDTIGTYIDMNQPDEFFGTFLDDLQVSEDPEDYEKTIAEDGSTIYLYKIDATMRPYSFIYLLQVVLLNNEDSIGNRVVGSPGYTITGLSRETDLFTRINSEKTIAITSEDVKPLIDNVPLDIENVTDTVGDVFAARMLTWGLPGINPLEEAEKFADTKFGLPTRRESVNPIDSNYVGIGLRLRNGVVYNIVRNITTEMNNHPAGGVITVIYDAGKIPDEILNRKEDPNTSGGGFNAKVEDWANTEEAEITI